MSMHNEGRTKLIEECGELIQITAKKSAYPDTDYHPDMAGSMADRMEEESGDVIAAILFVVKTHDLDLDRILQRAERKFELFTVWDSEP